MDLLVDQERRNDEHEDRAESEGQEEERVILPLGQRESGERKCGQVREDQRQDRRPAGDDERVQEGVRNIRSDLAQRRVAGIDVEQDRRVVLERRLEGQLERRRDDVIRLLERRHERPQEWDEGEDKVGGQNRYTDQPSSGSSSAHARAPAGCLASVPERWLQSALVCLARRYSSEPTVIHRIQSMMKIVSPYERL